MMKFSCFRVIASLQNKSQTIQKSVKKKKYFKQSHLKSNHLEAMLLPFCEFHLELAIGISERWMGPLPWM